MEEYKIRFIKEYWELRHRVTKLGDMLSRFNLGTLEFEPTCPIEILRAQFQVMAAYLSLLEVRAKIEGVDLNKEV